MSNTLWHGAEVSWVQSDLGPKCPYGRQLDGSNFRPDPSIQSTHY